MSRYAFQRLVTLLTLALALVLPSRVWAAIVQVCEEDRMTMAPPLEGPSCAVVTAVDEATGETSAAPICDPEGASAVAPPRILPVADDRIDAAPGCSDSARWTAVGPSSQDPLPATELAGATHQAIPIAALPAVRPPVLVAVATFMPIAGGARAGIVRGVYHPPR